MANVYYASAPDYTGETLTAALQKAFLPVAAEAGGIAGKRVMIKPNFLEWKGAEIPVCVDPALLLALCRLLKEQGAAVIAIIENPAVKSAPVIVEKMGIASQLAELGVEVENCAAYQFVDMPENSAFRRMEIACEYKEFDLVIDFAKAKTHAMMTLTLAVKNLFGLIRGSERLGWHLAVGRDFSRFADMLLDIYLLVKPHISLVDAVIAMEGNGPGSGTPVKLDFIACSTDAVALDASVAAKLGVNDLLTVQRAAERGVLGNFTECGDVPEVTAITLPDPPQLSLEWGVYFPVKLRKYLRKYMVSRPKVEVKRCVGCGVCAKMCPPQSLKIVNGKPVFKLNDCIRCFCCQEHCPAGAIVSEKTAFMRFADKFEKFIRKIVR
ncbi:MAG: DUF362 domain-containing protein [Lentisphaeria bacterium]|nr:DUF362 domain-containing protein [Lentisphaeria bacterium]